ncbi:hypothetical protein REC12_11320 [Desulfosporosinus sp. PR]|uniref:hypothetical protein n=1 Tax=Candidatus Desulfosporosinus nitrosoreducens TaxID=3401928 RepID=UPI0027FFCCBE|nr:hypothetical protein [Desulfosporosinus sp. PR]MDQ7094179.1 hypothetical protein [Desulfosporosinus sp. PR]
MSIEAAIKSVVDEKMNDGTIERLVSENLEKGINSSLEKLLGKYGDITEIIEKKIKEVMVGQLSSYDYSKYIVRLDAMLTEILKRTALDNKKILENFKELMVDRDIPKVVKLSDIFEEWKRHVARKVDTSKLEIDYNDGVAYECVTVTMDVEREEERSWSSSIFKYAKAIFECENDDELNFEIRLCKYREYPWSLSVEIDDSIRSLRYLDDFKIYLLQLKQADVKIEIDEEDLSDEVKPNKEPEASFS